MNPLYSINLKIKVLRIFINAFYSEIG